jgi:hypothetical protein
MFHDNQNEVMKVVLKPGLGFAARSKAEAQNASASIARALDELRGVAGSSGYKGRQQVLKRQPKIGCRRRSNPIGKSPRRR